MRRRRLAVVSAGLSQPSSTRLLADRLAAQLSLREPAAPADPFALSASFEDLLSGD